VVKVGGGTVEGHRDVIATKVVGFVVEGLMEVADELGMC
jgi:hypothetical protein